LDGSQQGASAVSCDSSTTGKDLQGGVVRCASLTGSDPAVRTCGGASGLGGGPLAVGSTGKLRRAFFVTGTGKQPARRLLSEQSLNATEQTDAESAALLDNAQGSEHFKSSAYDCLLSCGNGDQ
jgi:hypothetical protein